MVAAAVESFSMESEAYEIEVHEITDTPAFNTIKDMYVISMQHSTRRPALLTRLKDVGLTATVKILINKGYKEVPKKGVDSSTADLLHANKYICQLEKDNPLPVCIFEDDVEFVVSGNVIAKRMERLALPKQDPNSAKQIFPPTISLGSLIHLGKPQTIDDTHVTKVYAGGLCHAMIYPPMARNFILNTPMSSRAHDLTIYSNLDIITPRWPYSVQRHYRTDNSLTYDPTGLGSLILYMMNSSKRPRRAYTVFHFIGAFGGTVPIGLVILSAILSLVMHM